MRKQRMWYCKIGVAEDADLPSGCDLPMWMVVQRAFFNVTGKTAKFTFSGWTTTDNLTPGELNVLEDPS